MPSRGLLLGSMSGEGLGATRCRASAAVLTGLSPVVGACSCALHTIRLAAIGHSGFVTCHAAASVAALPNTYYSRAHLAVTDGHCFLCPLMTCIQHAPTAAGALW